MKKNRAYGELVKLAKKLQWESQSLLTDVESEYVSDFAVSMLPDDPATLSGADRRYLALSTLPWSFGRPKGFRLEDVWKKCVCAPTEHVLPTGCLQPRFFVIGYSPVLGLPIHTRVAMPSLGHVVLRKALSIAKIYERCWFTSIIKHSDHRVTSCIELLNTEIQKLSPKILLVLGSYPHAILDQYNHFGVPAACIPHPLHVLEDKRWKPGKYARIIREAINGIR